jgi:hypothetical protein
MMINGAPPADLDAAMQAVSDRVLADAAGQGRPLHLRIDRDFASPGGPRDERSDVFHVVAAIDRHLFSAGFHEGLEAGCALVMSVLQDEIISTLGRPWPEIGDRDGSRLGVLDVGLEPVGIAHWHLRGERLCAVGHLIPTCRARGWRIL